MNENNNKTKTLLIVTITAIILLVGGATFAFFQAQNGEGANANVNVTTNTVDKLSFIVTNDIVLDDINQDTFASGGANKTGSSEAKAILTANNKTNTATEHYSVYLEIENNNFEYTTPDNAAELILTVTDPTGNPVTAIEGLESVTVKGVTGFDITTKKELIRIAEDYAITGEPEKTDVWKIEVIFINLDSDQNGNTGKTFNAKIKIQKDRIIYLADHIKSLYTVDGENGLYLHDADLANGAGDNSLRYAGDDCELTEKGSQTYTSIYGEESSLIKSRNMTLEEYATLMEGYESLDGFINSWGVSTVEELYSFLGVSTVEQFMEFMYGEVLKVYYLEYDNNTIYSSISQAKIQAEKEGYVNYLLNNFACFGIDTTSCPEDNLYRIIGIFNEEVIGPDGNLTGATEERVKMIKVKSLGKHHWSGSSTNNSSDWSKSTFNTETLNGTYLTGLGEYANKIATTRWHVGGGTDAQIKKVTPSVAYQNEVGTPVNNTTHNAKIGLMYASDYGFAASTANWTTKLSAYNNDTNRNNNWMYLSTFDWTISPESSNSSFVFYVDCNGNLNSTSANSGYAARPSLYLKANVTYAGGDGSITNPFRIGM